MRVIKNRNVNQNFPVVMRAVLASGIEEESRAGRVLTYPEPMSVVTYDPCDRVLLDPARKANPFLHLFEAMWMLAGQRNAWWLDTWVHDFSARFGEEIDDGTMWGAYGHRWRHYFEVDQLNVAVEMLTKIPGTRRVVVGMWDASTDLSISAGHTSGVSGVDVPCNTQIYLRRRPPGYDQLDMLVCCRSNDVVWGMCGSNVVHFSVLLEYLAVHIGCAVGTMTQVANDAHVYDKTRHLSSLEVSNPYGPGGVVSSPLFTGRTSDRDFLEDLSDWMNAPTYLLGDGMVNEPLFRDLLVPMARVHEEVRRKDYLNALRLCEDVKHADWRAAAELFVRPKIKEPA